MLQADIINILLHKDQFEIYAPLLSKKHFGQDVKDNQNYYWGIFLVLKDFHEGNDSNITLKELYGLHMAQSDGLSEDKKDAIKQTYRIIGSRGSEKDNAAANHLLKKLRKQNAIFEVTDLFEEYIDKGTDDPFDKASIIIESLADDIEDEEESPYYTNDLLESEEDYTASHKWEWFSKDLDELVRGAGPERNCLVFALTNVGKTSFTAFSCVGFMRQGAKVLHLAIAEDSKVSLQRRYYQAAYNVDDNQLDQNKASLATKFKEEFEGKLYLAPTDSLTIRQAEKMIKEIKPDVVVFDDFKDLDLQLKGDMALVKKYGEITKRIKSLAIKYQFFALCCAQAADSATGKIQLSRSDIADSKVDIPGKFQFALGIARSPNAKETLRHVTIVKNKHGPEDRMLNMYIDEARCNWK